MRKKIEDNPLEDFFRMMEARNARRQKKLQRHEEHYRALEKSPLYLSERNRLVRRILAVSEREVSFSEDNSLIVKQLSEKWKKKTGRGWVGLERLYAHTPAEWLAAIDDALTFLSAHDPALEIEQVKIKYGGLRFYVSSGLETGVIRSALEQVCSDKRLIY